MNRAVVRARYNKQLLKPRQYQVHAVDAGPIWWFVVDLASRRVQIVFVGFVEQCEDVLNEESVVNVRVDHCIIANDVILKGWLGHYESVVGTYGINRNVAIRERVHTTNFSILDTWEGQ